MDSRETDSIINRIALGARYAKVNNCNGESIVIVVKDLTLQDNSWADFIYEQALEDGKKRELLTKSELAFFLDEAGVWTRENDDDIRNHEKAIAKLEIELLSDGISKRDRKRIESVLDATRSSLAKKKREKNVLFSATVDRYAESQRTRALVFCSIYSDMNNKYWNNWADFENEDDAILIDSMIDAIVGQSRLSTKQIREVARSNSWRFKWTAAKNCDTLFGKPIIELTRDQENLVYWSQVYDAAYESMDRPEDDIIDNDEALDEWFSEQARKRKERRATKTDSKTTNKWGLSSRVGKHTEVGIVANNMAVISEPPQERGWGNRRNVSAPQPGEVNELNSPMSKKFITSQNKKLKEHGVVREEDLRADSNSRRLIGEDVVFKKVKRKDGFTGKRPDKKFQGGTLRGRRE